MSARRRAEPGSQHRAGIADVTDVANFAGRGGYGGANGYGASGYSSGGYGGTHRAERQPASADFRAVLGNFATGVTIITALDLAAPDDPTPIGFTCSAFTSLSLDPPLISFSVSRDSSSRPRILAAGRFCVNILAFDQRGLCTRFATSGVDRFAGVNWWHSPGGSPVLDGSLAWIDATVEAEYPGGDHTIVIGHVRGLSYLRDAAPLVYHRGDYANCFPAGGAGALPRVS